MQEGSIVFEVSARPGGWFVTYGPAEFGPFETHEIAVARAAALKRQSPWLGRTTPPGGRVASPFPQAPVR